MRAVITYEKPGALREKRMAQFDGAKAERLAEQWIEDRKRVDCEGVEAGRYSLILHNGEGDCGCAPCRKARARH